MVLYLTTRKLSKNNRTITSIKAALRGSFFYALTNYNVALEFIET